MALRALIAVLAAGLLCSVASASPRAAAPVDIELAIDTTGSMGPSIKRFQRGAKKLVLAVEAKLPGARFAVVQFKDAGDTPEYELLQPLTADPKLILDAVSRLGPGGGGDNPEAYNVVFRNSYADKATGWRARSRKLVVVVGDAEPHGAGTVRLAGCLDASADPHALRTRQELIGMKTNGRTLLMVRQSVTATVSLDCYRSLAAAAASGGAARDAGSGLIGVVQALIAKAAGVKIKNAPATPKSTPKQGADRTPPRVTALKSGGNRGTTIRLVYRVSDDSGRSSEKVSVLSGSRIVTRSGWSPFGPSTGKAYYFDFPAPASMSGTYSFCVQSRDPSRNVSKPSCAPLLVY